MSWGAFRASLRPNAFFNHQCAKSLGSYARTRAFSTSREILRAVSSRALHRNIPASPLRTLLSSRITPFTQARFNSSSSSADANSKSAPLELPVLPSPAVGGWLLLSSTLVFAIIVVGGVTRLTESGLSITEWKPITGVLPPLSHNDWLVEFEKYKATPEFKLMNHSITLEDFKSIFYMEWGHRVLGRLIGLVFVGPLVYFAVRKKIPSSMTVRLTGLALLIGLQGALGWYMVKSGLEDSLMDTPGAVPRVSQYRLAAHLGAAFLLYAGMFGTGMTVIKEWKYACGAPWSGANNIQLKNLANNSLVSSFRRQAWALTGLVFLTALSGAFVAGLDAGLLYNEFPLMGGRLAPPTDELFSDAYAKSLDKSDKWWRNIFENPTTVQFDHRVLAVTTYFSTALLYARTFRPAMKAALPPLVRTGMAAAFAVANLQVLLGISTLLYLVPVPLAAAHQAGSVALLSGMMHLLVTLRRPGTVARAWRQVKTARVPSSPAANAKSAPTPPTAPSPIAAARPSVVKAVYATSPPSVKTAHTASAPVAKAARTASAPIAKAARAAPATSKHGAKQAKK